MPRRIFYNRVVYLQEADKLFRAIAPETRDCCEISGNLGQTYGFKTFEAFKFPEHDVCAGPFRDDGGSVRKFGVIIADQVWEHLDRPYAATRNVYEMLEDGGYFWVCVPFYVKYHLFPVDCSRWSALGLKNLLIESGFDENKIKSEQWGNLRCARRECGRRFASFDPAKDTLENDPNFPVVAWALAQK